MSILFIVLTCIILGAFESFENHHVVSNNIDMNKVNKSLLTEEIEFLHHMVPHHQDAVDMCNKLLRTAKNDEIVSLCNDIIIQQEKEINLMNNILYQ